jgi:hypothetical protein
MSWSGGRLCGALRYRAWLRIDDGLPRFPKISSAVPSQALDD